MADKRNGWIKYWRKSERNDLYFAEPFDKWHAWMDLLLMANPPDGSTGKPGTVKTSTETLKTRWSWGSRHKVRDFLGLLKGRFMIDFKTYDGKHGGVLINIKNFEDYQGKKIIKKKAEKTDEGTVSGTTRRNTSLYPTRIYKEEGIFESSLERDSKNPSQEEKSGGVGKAMTPDQLMEWLAQGEEDK